MLKNRIFIVIILIGSLLLGVVFVVFILRNIFSPQTPPDGNLPTPTQSPNETNQNGGIKYDNRGTDELLRLVTQRPTPPPSDQEIRSSLIQSLGNTTGVLYETDEIKIEYVSAPDDFEIEIKTENIEPAKTLGINWLRSQGFSDVGICSLPIFFYLSSDISQSLRGSSYTFNPLPEFCL